MFYLLEGSTCVRVTLILAHCFPLACVMSITKKSVLNLFVYFSMAKLASCGVLLQ